MKPFAAPARNWSRDLETERETMKDPTTEFFDELDQRGHEPLLRKATGTLRFDLVEGKSKARWFVTTTRGDVSVSRANREADCVITSDRPLFDAIVLGETNAMAAVLRGEIGIEGDQELLVLFQRVFSGPAASIRRREAALAGRSS
jgi:putative sterol carrier protein